MTGMDNIILTGFMGSGKSTVAIRLSYKMKMVLEDTDRRIEKEQEQSIGEIFTRQGEEAFRNMETDCLKSMLEEPEGRILSVGGGIPVREENRRILKQLGMVVYLRIRPDTVYERLKDDTTRPLLQGRGQRERIALLMEERSPHYESLADFIVDVDEQQMEEVLHLIDEAYQAWREEKESAERTQNNEDTCD